MNQEAPEMPISRDEAERMLSACEPGSEGFLEACDGLSRRKLGALCRSYIEKIDQQTN